MGKYLSGAGITGIYADANPAQRTANTYWRSWTDVDGDRIVDCDLLNFNAQDRSASGGDICGGPGSVVTIPDTSSVTVARNYGRDPLSLDADGTPIGLQTTQCGRREAGIPAAVQRYCDVYDYSLLDGWGKRRSEWQYSIGIQHEVLPRMSAELTYNRRNYSNLTVTDQLGIGCDRFNGVQEMRACQNGYLNFTSANYGFFNAVAPANPGLPGGGGYVVRGLANPNAALPLSPGSAVTIMDALSYKSNFVDTNFVWRGTEKFGLRGLRINGGTTTGRAVRDECYAQLDNPDVRQHDGVTPSCNPYTRWETNIRGTATYTIPKIEPRLHQGPGHLGTEQRRSRDAAVSGRRNGWPGRMLHPHWHHGYGDDVHGQPAQSWRAVRPRLHHFRPEAREEHPVLRQASQRRCRYLQPVQQGAGADLPGQLRHG
jgi:hypothetical protein